MHPSLQRTWERDDVHVDLKDALTIVAELDPPPDLRVSVFTFAATLLTQRAQVIPGTVPDLGALGHGGAGRR